jgi:hypothetical protein
MSLNKNGFEYGTEEEESATQRRHGRIFLVVLVIVLGVLWFISN